MLTLAELSQRVAELSLGHLSVGDFGEWFGIHSRGVYGPGQEALADAIDLIEEAFSEYYFEGLGDPGLIRKVEAALHAVAPGPNSTPVAPPALAR